MDNADNEIASDVSSAQTADSPEIAAAQPIDEPVSGAPAADAPVSDGPPPAVPVAETEPDRVEIAVEGDAGGPPPLAEEIAAAAEEAAAAEPLEPCRETLVALLFGAERPSRAALQTALEKYAQSCAATAELSCVDEAGQVLAAATRHHLEALEGERAQLANAAESANGHLDVFQKLFSELDQLVEAAGGELQQLDEADPQYVAAAEPVRTVLSNHKKGIEIIHRMFSRVRDRKKEPASGLPAVAETLEPPAPPADLEGLKQYAVKLSDLFHAARDANYHACQDARKHSESCQSACLAAAKGLLSGADGIDGGLQNEAALRASLADQAAASGPLIDGWFASYPRLRARFDEFCACTEIESHTVPRGTPFCPDTMEPLGTVADPELSDDEVAEVVRRGFSLHGQRIRPILVMVVRNS